MNRNHFLSAIRLLMLFVALLQTTAVSGEWHQRVLFSQDFENCTSPEDLGWQVDLGASYSLVSGDPVYGKYARLNASSDANVGVCLPIYFELLDNGFLDRTNEAPKGYVMEFDMKMVSGNVDKVSQSQFFVSYAKNPAVNTNGAVSKNSNFILSLTQPALSGSTPSTTWYANSLNNYYNSAKTLSGDEWYHVKVMSQPDVMFYSVTRKSDNELVCGGGKSATSITAVTGLSALLGAGSGELCIDNIIIYDYSNWASPVFSLVSASGSQRTYKLTNPNVDKSAMFYTRSLAAEADILPNNWFVTWDKETSITIDEGVGYLHAYVASDMSGNDPEPSPMTTQYVNAVKQTLDAPEKSFQYYGGEVNEFSVGFTSYQLGLEGTPPAVTFHYRINGGEWQIAQASKDPRCSEYYPVELGATLEAYVSADGYNDSPVATWTVGMPFGMMNYQYDSSIWFGGADDGTAVQFGTVPLEGLYGIMYYDMERNIWRESNLLTAKENVSAESFKFKKLQFEEYQDGGIYSSVDRVYALNEVEQGSYIAVFTLKDDKAPVVTAVDGLELNPWFTEAWEQGIVYYFKCTKSGMAKFMLNAGAILADIECFVETPPEMPTFTLKSMNGEYRTYTITNPNGSGILYYTTEVCPNVEETTVFASTTALSVDVTVTGTNYLWAYVETESGRKSEYGQQWVNGVLLALNPPVISNKSYDWNTELWTVKLSDNQQSVDGNPETTIWYSIDGGETMAYDRSGQGFTVSLGSVLTLYATSTGYGNSPVMSVTVASLPDGLTDNRKIYEYFYSSTTKQISLGDESEDLPGFYKMRIGTEVAGNDDRLLTFNENIGSGYSYYINYYGLHSYTCDRTYAFTGLTDEQYIYVNAEYESENLNAAVTPLENCELDLWNSSGSRAILKVKSNGTVKFRVAKDHTVRSVIVYQLPEWGYVYEPDANGNTLKYYYENATSDAKFYGVTTYAEDETKAGRIIIADMVTDAKGNVHNVTTIGGYTENREDLKSVVFGQNITTVDGSAFYNCQQLESVTLNNNLKSLGNSAFNNCQQLEGITLNSNLETLGSSTFSYCPKLATVNLADTKVTTIPYRCFYRTGLTEINIPATITELGNEAFYGCDSAVVVTVDVANIPAKCFQPYDSSKSKLRTINIGKDVTSIGNNAFQSQAHVTAVNIDPGVSDLTIGNYAFNGLTALGAITLPEGVTSIGNSAFYNCDKLETVALPASVTSLGTEAFSSCDNLRSFTFAEGSLLTVIPNSCFNNCQKLETIALPASLSSLGTSAFSNCSNLQSVTIADGSTLTEIPNSCFYYCQKLETVTIPESVTKLGDKAFNNCSALTELTFGGDITVGSNALNGLSSLEKLVLPGVNYPFTGNPSFPNSLTIFVHPEMVETYKGNNFTKNCHIVAIGTTMTFAVTTTDALNLQNAIGGDEIAQETMELKVTGPLTGTDINYIHANMPYLQVLDLTDAYIVAGTDDNKYNSYTTSSNPQKPSNSTYKTEANVIGRYMFYNMPKLKRLLLPSGATTIGQYAIAAISYSSGYSALREVVMPTALTTIDKYAFQYDTKLVVADIPATVTSIGDYAFYYCQELKNAAIPEGVTTIGQYAFNKNNKLASHIVIPATCTKIGDYAFSECYAIPSITLTEGVTTIGSYAFNGCKAVTEMTLPSTVTSIGNYAFANMVKLTSFAFPAAITVVPDYVLRGCTSLQRVTLAEGTTKIGYQSFCECSKLSDINLLQPTLTEIGSGAFQSSGFTALDLSGATALTKVGSNAFNGCKALVTAVLPNGITTLSSSIFANCTALQSVNVPTSVSAVPDSYCSYCTALTSVAMHDGITKIGSKAFYNCKQLPTIALNNLVTSIGSSAFSGCEALEIEALPTSLKTIDQYAFQNTKAMAVTLTMPETLTTLGNQAFYGSGITGVVFTKMPTSFSTYVFYDCKQLATVTLPADMTTIPDYTFYGTTALKTIDLPLGLTKISDGAFYQSGLTSIDLSTTKLDAIGSSAFYQSGLETIALPASLTTIGSSAFYNSGLTTIDLSTTKVNAIGSNAFSYSKITELILPKSVTKVGSDLATYCTNLKKVWMSKKLAYNSNDWYYSYYGFDYFDECSALETLRIYAGTPPEAYDYYLDYRTNCVLEVPLDAVDSYKNTYPWSEFKEIVGFESSDELGAADFAMMKDLYNRLGGATWTNPWNMTNNLHTTGKWHGVTTEVDAEDEEVFHITEIDLTEQGLVGPLPKSLFTLPTLTKINMSHNAIEAKVDTMITDENTVITELNIEGNHLKGDLYPFVSKLPNLTSLNVSYNWLTAYSQPTSNEKLSNGEMYRGYQFIDWATKTVNVPEELMDEVVIDFTPGTPIAIQSNSLQTYRHEAGDYNLSFSDMYRFYKSGDYLYTTDTEIVKGEGDRWDIYSGSLFKAPKGLVAYTHGHPWYSYITYIFRIDWKDGDVNADQAVDVADVQNVVYYALNDQKPSGQIYNFTAADLNSDNKVNVSDIVGCVGLVLDSTEPEATGARVYNKVEGESRNVMTANGNSILLANADEVAALQLTVSGASAAQLQLNSDLRSRFSVSMRDVTDGVRIVVYSPMGNALAPGEHQLLSGLPAGATVTDVRLVDSEAQRLSVRVIGSPTAIDELMADDIDLESMPIYDLSGRRVGKWNTLPRGIYIVNLNGKQFKVRK